MLRGRVYITVLNRMHDAGYSLEQVTPKRGKEN